MPASRWNTARTSTRPSATPSRCPSWQTRGRDRRRQRAAGPPYRHSCDRSERCAEGARQAQAQVAAAARLPVPCCRRPSRSGGPEGRVGPDGDGRPRRVAATVVDRIGTARCRWRPGHRKLPVMVEVFASELDDGRVRNRADADSLIRAIAIVSGLGTTSAYVWLKLPVVDDLERVMRSTSLPTLLLGGDPGEDQAETFSS